MIYKFSISVHSIVIVALSVISCSASAQSGVPFQLDEVQEQLVRIESGVDRLGETVDELVSVDRSRCDRPVSWNRKLPDDERFALALNGGAYCDLETGLVWMETPIADELIWREAISRCRILAVDGRMGWHLPTVEELQSLIDERNSSPALPLGHPFKGVLPSLYWTSSPDEDSVIGQFREVWLIDLNGGLALTRDATDLISVPGLGAGAWCVRGGANLLPISDVNLIGDEVEPF